MQLLLSLLITTTNNKKINHLKCFNKTNLRLWKLRKHRTHKWPKICVFTYSVATFYGLFWWYYSENNALPTLWPQFVEGLSYFNVKIPLVVRESCIRKSLSEFGVQYLDQPARSAEPL